MESNARTPKIVLLDQISVKKFGFRNLDWGIQRLDARIVSLYQISVNKRGFRCLDLEIQPPDAKNYFPELDFRPKI